MGRSATIKAIRRRQKQEGIETHKLQSQRCNEKFKTIGKVALCGIALYGAVLGIQYHNNEGFINDVLYVPIIEEIFYRGALQGGIGLAQRAYNNLKQRKELTPEQEEAQETFRIYSTAALFGAAHFDSGIGENLFYNFWALGRATSYLTEQSGSLLPSMVFHAAHNALVFIRDGVIRPTTYTSSILASHHWLYLPTFAALGKKYIPIPDCVIPKFVSNIASKIRNYFFPQVKLKPSTAKAG